MIGRWISGSSTVASAACTACSTVPAGFVPVVTTHATCARRRLSAGARAAELVEPLGDPVQLTAQVVAGRHLADRHPERGQLAGEVLGVGLRPLGAAAVLVQRHPVAVVLPVLRQQDQRGGVGGLGGEGQVEQDERVGVPLVRAHEHEVEGDPHDHEHGLDRQVAAGAEEPGDPLGEAREACRGRPRPAGGPAGARRGGGSQEPQASATSVGAIRTVAWSAGLSCSSANRSRQLAGSRWSSTSSTVTAPSRCPAVSTTGPATRL